MNMIQYNIKLYYMQTVPRRRNCTPQHQESDRVETLTFQILSLWIGRSEHCRSYRFLYIYIYTYTYICMQREREREGDMNNIYIYIYIYTYIYIYINIYIYIYIHIHIHIHWTIVNTTQYCKSTLNNVERSERRHQRRWT